MNKTKWNDFWNTVRERRRGQRLLSLLLALTLCCQLVPAMVEQAEAQIAEDGDTYIITAPNAPGICLAAKDGGTADKTDAVVCNPYKGEKWMQWKIRHYEDEWYVIENCNASGKVLDAQHNDDNTNVYIYGEHDGDNQLWKFLPIPGNPSFCNIVNRNGQYLDLYDGKTGNNSTVKAYMGGDNGNRRWMVINTKTLDLTAGSPETYTITSALDGRACLSVPCSSTDEKIANALNAELAPQYSGESSQRFHIVPAYDEWFMIVDAGTGSRIEYSELAAMKAAGETTGENVYARNGSEKKFISEFWYTGHIRDRALWKFVPAEDGTYYIQSKHGLNLDIEGGKIADAANVEANEASEAKSQRWKIENTSIVGNSFKTTSERYTIRTALGSSKTLTFSGSSLGLNNTVLQEYKGNKTQQYNIIPVYGDWYRIMDCGFGSALTPDGSFAAGNNNGSVQAGHADSTAGRDFAAENNSSVQATDYRGWENQLWKFEEAGNGQYRIVNKTGKYLDVQGSQAVDNANVQLYEATNNNDQKWTITSIDTGKTFDPTGRYLFDDSDEPLLSDYDPATATEEDTFRIVTALDKTRCICPVGDGKADGTNIHLWTSDGKACMQFHIIPVSSGWSKIINADSGKALEATSDGNVQINTYNGSDSQLWKPESAGNGYYYIINKSEKYLDVDHANASNGANVLAYKKTKNANQQWSIVNTSYTVADDDRAALRLQVVTLQYWYDWLTGIQDEIDYLDFVEKLQYGVGYGEAMQPYWTTEKAEHWTAINNEASIYLPQVTQQLADAKAKLAALGEAGISNIVHAEPLTSDKTYEQIQTEIAALETQIGQQQTVIDAAQAALQELVGERDPLYPERKAAYDEAVQAQNELRDKIAELDEGTAVAAKIAGDALLDALGNTDAALTAAAHEEMIAALQAEIAELKAQIAAEKANKAKETAMNSAKSASDEAKAAWDAAKEAYALASAKATGAKLAIETAKEAYQKTHSQTDLNAYNKALGEYNGDSIQLETRSKTEATAKTDYQQKLSAYQTAKTAYDEEQASIAADEKSLEAKETKLEAYQNGVFEDFDEEEFVVDVSGTESEKTERIAVCEAELLELWERVPTLYRRFRQSAESTEQSMEAQAEYAQVSQRIDALRDAIAQMNASIVQSKPPVTFEEAEARVRSAAAAYLRAQRDYQEYAELLRYIANSEKDCLDKYANTDYPDQNVYWIATNALADGTRMGISYVLKLPELETAMQTAETNLRTAMEQLNALEIHREKSMTEAEINAQVRKMQLEYESVRTKWNSYDQLPEGYFKSNLNKYTKELYIDSGNTFKNVAISSQRSSWQKSILKDPRISSWAKTVNSDEYIETFQNLKVLEAEYSDENGKRSDVIARIEKLGDQYALQVCTGSVSGTGKILFFTIVYTDTDGMERKEYIFPGEDAYEDTLASGSSGALVNQEHMDAMTALGQGGSVSQCKALQSWSADTYLFRTQYKMDETASEAAKGFRHFEMFGENVQRAISNGGIIKNNPGDGSMTNEWACTGMRLYKVNDYYGMSALGYGGSSQTRLELEFSGTCIGEMVLDKYNPSWSCDKMFIMDPALNKKYTVNYPGTSYSTGKVGKGSGGGELVRISDENSEYLFKLDIADSYGAGVESLVNFVTANSSKTKLKDMGLAECLTYQIVYYDTWGARRMVELPVITSSAAWATQNGVSKDSVLFGYAQQGDSLVFSAYLPDFKELDQAESQLVFKSLDWKPVGGSSAAKSNIATRQSMAASDAGIVLNGMQIYAPGTWSATASVENGVIVPAVAGEPTYYDVAGSSGIAVNYNTGGQTYLSLKDLRSYPSGASLKPKSEGQMYMLVITTDENEMAGTTASPTITLNYTARSGRKVSTSSEGVSEASRDFYGYWPSATGADIIGQQSTGAGGQVKLLYRIIDDDVNTFDSVHIAMPDNSSDDWQITGIQIMKLTTIGPRQAVWESVYDNSGKVLLSDRRYDREVDGKVLLNQSGKILLQDGDQKDIEINGGKVVVEDGEQDWEDIRYYMDAETAQSMLGFQKTRAVYTVNVKVAGEGSSTVSNGDCGSINNFYFQLVFANGKSAYVLANQQLSGDGFRTGHEETFTISTNRDYGELQAVRIIPDDNSKDSSIFDKLNIDKIIVSRGSNDAVCRTWVIENVGWIEIDYHDDAESYGINGRPGRAESTLARNFTVSYPTYSIKLLFSLGTSEMDPNTDDISSLLEGKDAETRAKIEAALTTVNQYQGEVSMILYYRNSKGEVIPYECDLVKAIADYANKSVSREESTDSEGNIKQGRQYKSDIGYMFRPGHLDRFELTINDATELISAEIIATGVATQSTFWKIASCNAMLLTESGELNINGQGEYEKTNVATAQALCEDVGLPQTLWCPARNAEATEFNFSANEIKVDLQDNTWEVAPPRTPASENDSANIYVYLADDSAVPADMMSLIHYTTGYGQAYQSATRVMSYDSGRRMFHVSGIDISKIAVLNSISMSMSSANTPGIYIDHVVVQQVRSDVVINTYNFVPASAGDRILRGILTIKPTGGGSSVISDDKQVATIRFGAGTETAHLVEENRDIAVALRYTSTNDGNDREYNSSYIYLTDQQILAIRAGGTAEITFHEKYVGEVKGLIVLATGKLKAEVDMASVGVYRDNAGNDVQDCVGWYSFYENVELGTAPYTMLPISDHTKTTSLAAERAVSPLTVTLTTGTTEQDPNPGTTDPVRMVVTYLDNGNPEKVQTVIFSDIRNNLVSGSFDAGQTATVRVILQGVKELRSITLEPYSTDPDTTSTDAWYISGMSLQMNQNLKLVKYETGTARKAVEKKEAVYNVADVTPVENETDEATISLSESSITIDLAGETRTKNLKVNNADGAVVWESSAELVATVVNGLVTGEAVGESTVTVRDNKGNQATCTVTVINSSETPDTTT